MRNVIHIDGSFGEGGGQILRSALSLSMITGIAFEIKNIRAGRKKPGLMRQHLTCVQAAAAVCDATIVGAELGSQELFFDPKAIKGGEYNFAIGTAGSTMLVAQTVFPALIMADRPSKVILQGGTHNIYAPTYDFIVQAFLPILGKMGVSVKGALERYGFYPTGGGKVSFEIKPVVQLSDIALLEHYGQTYCTGEVIVANLPVDIAKRELATIGEVMNWNEKRLFVREVRGVTGTGNVVQIKLGHGNVMEMITVFGKAGLKAEKVAQMACDEAKAYINCGAVIGEHLADQLIIFMALAGKGKFLTSKPSLHTKTNIEVIQKFLSCDIDVEDINENLCVISFDGETFVNEAWAKKLEKEKNKN